MGATLEQVEHFRPGFGPALKFAQQAALADTCITGDGDDLQAALDVQSFERRLQQLQLGVAPDHAGLDPLDAACRHPECARLGAVHEVAAQRLVDAFDRDPVFGHVEHPTHLGEAVAADAQAADGCALFHARGDADRDATDAASGIDAAAEQRAAAVRAHTHIEAGLAMA